MYENLKFNNERLKQILREKNLTRAEAAEQIGISNDAFTNYRKGRLPKTEYLYAIAQFFDKSMEWFLTEDRAMENSAVLAREEARNDENSEDKNLEDITLEEMFEILEKLMSNDNPNLRGWTVVQFRQAFGKYCQTFSGVKENFSRYIVDKKNIQ